jgi:pantoate--beta-alanine ligase
MTEILRTADQVRERVSALRSRGQKLALVPTMGYLHEGHLSLMREGKRRAEVCAASLFVNPRQFGPNEDLGRYPRDEDGDLEKCRRAGVDFLWAPEVAEVYPKGFQTSVKVAELEKGLCGASRPHHFEGVATVVAKLFNLFRPDVALFGQKDYQQLKIIERLNRDLDFGIEIVGMPIVRESDGLAMSSRNAYLTPEERARALGLSRAIRAAEHMRHNGELRAARLVDAARAELEAVQVRIDYLALVNPETLEPLETAEGPARILVAAFVGKTRLIDNSLVG